MRNPFDFNPGSSKSFATAFVEKINTAMEAENQAGKPRDYLGGSRLGEECARMLQYEFEGAPKSRQFPGETLRIFERGHAGEELMIRRLRLAGFEIMTEKPVGGGQLGFRTAWCERTERYRIRGHYDGVITKVPDEFDLAVPCIWENKVLGEKSWKAVVKSGVVTEKPVYAGQIATYQAYSGLTDNPALFTAENANTGEIYSELVPFSARRAQDCTDRAVTVLQATDAGERLPRPFSSPDFFKCRMCDYHGTCWNG